jgi:EmrB/QacA subfamily drug resistance transporter
MNANNTSIPAYSRSLTKRQVIGTMAGVMVAMLLSALDQTVVGVAMPRIVADLGGFNQYTWATSIYMITSAVTIPIVGKLSDMYGRKIFYVIGIVVFTLASLACGLSNTMTMLIVFRGIQGIGGGIMMTNSFTVIADVFPPGERAKYQGLLTAVFSFASVIGPTTGGFLTDNISWHWIFFINIPIGAIAVSIFIKFFPGFRTDNVKHSIDVPGVIALVLIVVPAMLALSWGGVKYDWGSPRIIGMLVFAAVMLLLFLFLEHRAAEPIIPLYLFKNRIVAISNVTSFLTGMGMFGAITFIPLFLQGVLGASATASGNMQIPQSIAVMIASIVTGQLISRLGRYRLFGVISMIIICTGMFSLSRLDINSHYWQVILFNIIIGFGLGTTMPVFTIAIQNSVPYNLLGVATSSNTFIRSFGGSIGLAVMGSIMNNRFLAAFTGSIPDAVRNDVSMDELTALAHNPQALVNPAAQQQLKEMLTRPGTGANVFDQVMLTLRESLSSAISDAFLIGFMILMIGLIAAFFFKGKVSHEGAHPADIPPGRPRPH